MSNISRAIVETPIWVWALLAFLIVIGVRSLKPATAPLWRLAILPLVFLVWGLAGVLTTFKLSPLTISAWCAALLVGGALGYVLMARRSITIDRQNRYVTLPGSPANLAMILLIFAAKRVRISTGDPTGNHRRPDFHLRQSRHLRNLEWYLGGPLCPAAPAIRLGRVGGCTGGARPLSGQASKTPHLGGQIAPCAGPFASALRPSSCSLSTRCGRSSISIAWRGRSSGATRRR